MGETFKAEREQLTRLPFRGTGRLVLGHRLVTIDLDRNSQRALLILSSRQS